jgi:hypothetical protein
MVRLSKQQQDAIRQEANRREAQERCLQDEQSLSTGQISYYLGSAIVNKKRTKRRITGFNLFMRDWFSNNKLNGETLGDKQLECADGWKKLSEEEREKYEERAKKEIAKPKTLNESEEGRNIKRAKYLEDINNTLDMLAAECGLESVLISGSRLAGEQFSALTGTAIGLAAMGALNMQNLPLNFGTQIQHDMMHSK